MVYMVKVMIDQSKKRIPAMKKITSVSLFVLITFLGCSKEAQLKKDLTNVFKENPEILADAIKNNPVEFMEAVKEAASAARSAFAKKRDEKTTKYYDEPLKPVIRKDETIRGTKDAPLVLVEYSDFECGYCSRGYSTVMELMNKYKGKVQFIYKHLPLSFHKQALISSQYYEAIRLQDEKKAFRFHDEIFKKQAQLKRGEKFLKKIAKNLKVDMKKLKKDVVSKKVLERIKEDQKEAEKFGMRGTPGFILNGVPIRGAHPIKSFVNIIEELKKRNKISL